MLKVPTSLHFIPERGVVLGVGSSVRVASPMLTQARESLVRHVAWPNERLEDLPTLRNLEPVRLERRRRELPTLPDIDPLRHDVDA